MDNINGTDLKTKSAEEIIKGNPLVEITPGLYRIGDTGWIFRDRDSSFTPENIQKFTLFGKVLENFQVLTGFKIPEYILEKGYDSNGKERLFFLIKEIKGFHLDKAFETQLSNIPTLQSFQIFSGLIDYFKICFQHNLPMIPDLKLAQFVIEEESGCIFMVDIDLPTRFSPYPIYLDTTVHPVYPEIYYYKVITDYLRFTNNCKEYGIEIPLAIQEQLVRKIELLNLKLQNTQEFRITILLENHWSKQLAAYRKGNGYI